ncbi:MAG: outer membrane protein assembly factor BamD [Terriglobia bacterium]
MRAATSRFFLLAVLLSLAGVGCHRHTHAEPDLSESAEPDKILYQRAVEDIGNKRYDTARLVLQTLINTYPDSDYLPSAKLAIADSYFNQGSSGALNHAEIEYKDFITFFPNAPEVAYAQYRAGMCHFRQLEKSDRDRTHARRAEQEFQLLLKNYAHSEYADQGEKKLIQVQELLAEGEFGVARFYYVRGPASCRAVAVRLAELVERYPNHSKRDRSLWMLGQCLQNSTTPMLGRDSERAAGYYARLVREHPLSDFLDDAKAELTALAKPIPEPDPVLLARQQNAEPVKTEEQEKRGLLGRMFGLVGGRPNIKNAAARLGPPPLEPPADTPKLPPPIFAGNRTGVTAQTVEDVPQGVLVANAGEAPDGASKDPENNPTPRKKKKSFWRKLIPF